MTSTECIIVLDCMKGMTEDGKKILLEELEANNKTLFDEVQASSLSSEEIDKALKGKNREAIVKELCEKFNADKTWDRLGYFYDRWQDERKYEDFNEYSKAITNAIIKVAPEAAVTKVTKGFKIYVTYKTVKMYFTISSKSVAVKVLD